MQEQGLAMAGGTQQRGKLREGVALTTQKVSTLNAVTSRPMGFCTLL